MTLDRFLTKHIRSDHDDRTLFVPKVIDTALASKLQSNAANSRIMRCSLWEMQVGR